MDEGWVCASCRSINTARNEECYSCKAPRSGSPSWLSRFSSTRIAPVLVAILAVLALGTAGVLFTVSLLSNGPAAQPSTSPTLLVVSEFDPTATSTPTHVRPTPSPTPTETATPTATAEPTKAPATRKPAANTPAANPPTTAPTTAAPTLAPTPAPPTPTPVPTPTPNPNWTVTGTIGSFVKSTTNPAEDTVTYTITSAAPGAVCYLWLDPNPSQRGRIAVQVGDNHTYEAGGANTWTQAFQVGTGQGLTVPLRIVCSLNGGTAHNSAWASRVVA